MTDETANYPVELVLSTLPVAVTRSLASYHDFSAKTAPDAAKDFIAHHNACKAGLGHISTLLKLYILCRKAAPEKAQKKSEEFEALLLHARHVLLSTEPQ
ncbi:MAG: hypothetical protein JWM96_218 [Alphaproteobacteria bacterium]|nr:hypothetical protein [Alphaproteobacteria bacterium]